MFYAFVSLVAKIWLKITFFIKIEGEGNIPKTGGVIICCNHISNLDPIAIGGLFKRHVRFLAKKELFENSLLGNFISALGATPIDRGKSDVGAVKKCMSILGNKEALLMFPQGTRRETFLEKDVKAGAVNMAIKVRVPIVPVGINGTFKPFTKVTLRVGKTIDIDYIISKIDGLNEEEKSPLLAKLLYEKIAELLN